MGSQVLGGHLYGNYFASPVLMWLNYLSIVAVVIVYALVFFKQKGLNRLQSDTASGTAER